MTEIQITHEMIKTAALLYFNGLISGIAPIIIGVIVMEALNRTRWLWLKN